MTIKEFKSELLARGYVAESVRKHPTARYPNRWYITFQKIGYKQTMEEAKRIEFAGDLENILQKHFN